ncbi:unnamed protein product [Symbiodinium natans]|uniref:Uncharacterized protein n=1 Tax=Symbiodinium natans TaxID=878477 RepID=A0A812RDZ7_9DINO|nr:unnamed protein product [Symbiodinium natans]
MPSSKRIAAAGTTTWADLDRVRFRGMATQEFTIPTTTTRSLQSALSGQWPFQK